MGEKRDEKGRFRKGYSGGPGRGQRKPSKPMTYEDIELLLQPDLKDSDPKVRHTATRLLIAIKNKMPDQQDGSVFDDPVLEFIVDFVATYLTEYETNNGESLSGRDALRLVCEHPGTCPDSPLKRNFIQVVEDGDL